MSQNNNPPHPNKNKRGIKRSAEEFDADQPRTPGNYNPAKKQRTDKYHSSNHINQLLQMSESQIHNLPEGIKQQAILMRQQNQSNSPMHDTSPGSGSSTSDSSSTSSSPLPMPYDMTPDTEHDEKITRIPQAIYQYNPQPVVYIPVPTANEPGQHRVANSNNEIYIPSNGDINPNQYIPSLHHYKPNKKKHKYKHTVSQPPTVNVIKKKKQKTTKSNCSCFFNFIWIISAFLLFLPFFIAILRPQISLLLTSDINYCDSSGRGISFSSCSECPLDAVCVDGKARCKHRGYIDTASNKCIAMVYSDEVINGYTDMFNKISGFFYTFYDDYNEYIYKCCKIEEWNNWFLKTKQLTFSEFCKSFEMEILVLFFILTWYLPLFRCLLVFLWCRMILPIIPDNDDLNIRIYIKVLSYFAPIMFGYDLWNRIVAFF